MDAILTPSEKMSAALAKANARAEAAEAEVERLRTVLRELEAMRKNFNAGWDRVILW